VVKFDHFKIGIVYLSDNSLASYQSYKTQADSFQKQWQGHLYTFHLADKKLKPEDFSRFPVFEYQPADLPYSKLMTDTALMIVLTTILLFIAVKTDKQTI